MFNTTPMIILVGLAYLAPVVSKSEMLLSGIKFLCGASDNVERPSHQTMNISSNIESRYGDGQYYISVRPTKIGSASDAKEYLLKLKTIAQRLDASEPHQLPSGSARPLTKLYQTSAFGFTAYGIEFAPYTMTNGAYLAWHQLLICTDNGTIDIRVRLECANRVQSEAAALNAVRNFSKSIRSRLSREH